MIFQAGDSPTGRDFAAAHADVISRRGEDPQTIAREWRARAEEENLSLREVVITATERSGFAGTAT